MKPIKVTIEEHVVQTFDIMANNLDEAVEIAEQKYKNGDLVVENGEVHATVVAAYDPETNESTEWSEI